VQGLPTPQCSLASGASGQPPQRISQTRGFFGADLFEEVAQHQFGAPPTSGLLPPPARSASGYRDYEREIVDRVRFIHRGQAAGLTSHKVRQILAFHGRGEHRVGMFDRS
jgi:hypothetical protein